MARLLITGAAGYIGSVLVAEALKAGHKVVALDRFFFGEDVLGEYARKSGLRLIKKDIRDAAPEDFRGIDAVIDLAALSNDPAGDLDRSLTRSINCRGRIHVAHTAKAAGVRRYVMSSSCSVFGYGSQKLTEKSPCSPQTEYARSMLDAERTILRMADSRFCSSALRLSTVFGLSRRMRFDLVVNTMTKSAVNTNKIVVTGGGKQWRPLIHVRDAARGFLHFVNHPVDSIAGEAFNIGRDNYRMSQLAFAVREALPIALAIEIKPETNDTRSYRVSFAKAKKVIGYAAQHEVEYGVREIYDAIKQDRIDLGSRTVTVNWYKHLLEAERLVDGIRLNGRIL